MFDECSNSVFVPIAISIKRVPKSSSVMGLRVMGSYCGISIASAMCLFGSSPNMSPNVSRSSAEHSVCMSQPDHTMHRAGLQKPMVHCIIQRMSSLAAVRDARMP